MTETERSEILYEQAVRRIRRLMAVMGVAGTAAGAALQNWQYGLSFALGAAISWTSFNWLHAAVDALDPSRPHARRKRVFLFVWLRYILLGAGAYAIVKIFGVNGIAALIGLFVPAAAVVAEIIYELVHGT
jgi:hypothetical protein